MTDINRHGLSRHIPASTKREIRQRSRFGCVVCRAGFYTYEHIEPEFRDARSHDPDCICCLCGACHDRVTRGQTSKAQVFARYRELQNGPRETIRQPRGPIDFHEGKAELGFGCLTYNPAVRTVLRYHGRDLIRLTPGKNGSPGLVSAIFTNDEGNIILHLEENEWIGSLNNWDIEVVGQRISVRRHRGRISLVLRLDPPGRVVIERLDMRVHDAHLLVANETYAIGRYIRDGTVNWVHARLDIERSSTAGSAIEFLNPAELRLREERLRGRGSRMSDRDGTLVVDANLGAAYLPMGIVVASMTGAFTLQEFAVGNQTVDLVRDVILSRPQDLCRTISTRST